MTLGVEVVAYQSRLTMTALCRSNMLHHISLKQGALVGLVPLLRALCASGLFLLLELTSTSFDARIVRRWRTRRIGRVGLQLLNQSFQALDLLCLLLNDLKQLLFARCLHAPMVSDALISRNLYPMQG